MNTYPRGTHIGPYEILALLPGGKGGMGAVYLARPRPNYAAASPPLVALKMAYDSHNDFLKYEVEHMERLSHPNILRVLPIPTTGSGHGRPVFIARAEPQNPNSPYYIAVEYMTGGSIARLIEIRKSLTPSEAVEITGQVADALIYIHTQQIVHLDIKDTNILLREPLSRWSARAPRVVVSDFGIAWSTERKQLATVYGSQFYTAPERAAGAPPNPQNDVFSLGVLLYEMLVGRTPFTGAVIPGTRLADHSRPSALNPAVSPELEQVVMRALETDPSQRYQTMQQFRFELDMVPSIRRPQRIRLPLFQSVREAVIVGLSAVALLLVTAILAVVGVNAIAIASPAPTATATFAPTATPEPTSAPVVVATAPPAPTATSLVSTATSAAHATGAGRPTATALPPTATPLPPTATPVPPTAVPARPRPTSPPRPAQPPAPPPANPGVPIPIIP